MTITLILVLLGLVTVVAAVGSVYAGRWIGPLRASPRIDRLAVVLSGLVLLAAAIALALGGPGRDTTCSGPMRDNVAAVIGIYAIPSLAIALGAALGALVAGTRRLGGIALLTALVAAVVDYFALANSVHICLN